MDLDFDLDQKIADKLASMGFKLIERSRYYNNDYLFTCSHLIPEKFLAPGAHILSNNFKCIEHSLCLHQVFYLDKIE